jgi:ArsR family transcriptional regulator, arsenate/arsenite/antimonite-responsive transcriptional repressor
MALKPLPVLRERGVCCALPEVDRAWADGTASLLKALADPTRLTMLAALWKADQPVCVCDFAGDLGLTQPTISHHMAKLRDAGLVEAEKSGIWTYYRLRRGLPRTTRRLLGEVIG